MAFNLPECVCFAARECAKHNNKLPERRWIARHVPLSCCPLMDGRSRPAPLAAPADAFAAYAAADTNAAPAVPADVGLCGVFHTLRRPTRLDLPPDQPSWDGTSATARHPESNRTRCPLQRRDMSHMQVSCASCRGVASAARRAGASARSCGASRRAQLRLSKRPSLQASLQAAQTEHREGEPSEPRKRPPRSRPHRVNWLMGCCGVSVSAKPAEPSCPPPGIHPAPRDALPTRDSHRWPVAVEVPPSWNGATLAVTLATVQADATSHVQPRVFGALRRARRQLHPSGHNIPSMCAAEFP
eukprot:363968-Chlamydomonas_euryale.AAC.6